MISWFKELLKKLLPKRLVKRIQKKRRDLRQQQRFLVSQGKDICKDINLFGMHFAIYINPYLNGGVDDDIDQNGTWEPEIAALIKEHLPREGTFVDIGANIGFHTLFAACVTGPDGHVFAFEPLRRLQEQMQKSVRENGFNQIVIKPVALGLRHGIATLSLVEENVGASSLQNVADDRVVGGVAEVTVHTLDTYIQQMNRLDLIKIDIEGGEFEALRGGENVLRRFKPVIILEFSPHVYEKNWSGKSLELYEYIKGLDYVITDIGMRVSDIEACLRSNKLKELHTNLLCVPN